MILHFAKAVSNAFCTILKYPVTLDVKVNIGCQFDKIYIPPGDKTLGGMHGGVSVKFTEVCRVPILWVKILD